MKRYALSEREPNATLRLEVVVINLGNLATTRGTGNNSSAASKTLKISIVSCSFNERIPP